MALVMVCRSLLLLAAAGHEQEKETGGGRTPWAGPLGQAVPRNETHVGWRWRNIFYLVGGLVHVLFSIDWECHHRN